MPSWDAIGGIVVRQIMQEFEGERGSERPNLAEAEFEDLNACFFAISHSRLLIIHIILPFNPNFLTYSDCRPLLHHRSLRPTFWTMDPILEELRPKSDDDKFLSRPYEERWIRLQPVIVQLYTRGRAADGRTATLDQVVEFMRTYYSFHAAATEYRRRFKDWGVTKRMVKEDKDAITSALARRKRPGASVSAVTTQHDGEDKPLDFKKLKRHLLSRKACIEVAPGLLCSWNLPYAAFISSLPKNPDAPSPFGTLGATPGYLHVESPEALTPGGAAAGPSPRMQLVYEKHREYCTSLFLQGRIEQLVVSLPKEERRFALAKIWGKETANPNSTPSIGLTPQARNPNSPWTPSAFLNLSSSPSSPEVSNSISLSLPPTQLCKWSVHVLSECCVFEDRVEAPTWPNSQPPAHSDSISFVDSLNQSLASNDFTTTPKADLPLAHDLITRSLEEHPSPLQFDAWKLAIMAANRDLLHHLWEDNQRKTPEGIEAIHPFHLAAAFLDGGNQCCGVFTDLCQILPSSFAFYHNLDDHGHTILDALVVAILRSHTSIQPGIVSYGFHSLNRFPGEENDICGRWDAEAPMVRELFKQGYARIPTRWKHPFCHTAVQAIYHSIVAIFASPASPNINTESGLFVRRCTACGLELRLRPLHTVVVTAFYLAQLGRPGETLFGALAIVEQARSDSPHRSVSPLGDDWPGTPTSGFSQSSDHDSCWDMFQEEFHDNWLKLPCNGLRIGLLWASIQTELLTYRRIRDGDSWISENFSMTALRVWLEEEDTQLSMPLIQSRMFKDHTPCGWFGNASEFLCPAAEEICTDHFMNMDIYNRTSYIRQPDLLQTFENVEQTRLLQEPVSGAKENTTNDDFSYFIADCLPHDLAEFSPFLALQGLPINRDEYAIIYR
ncbi:hypothetical protein FPHYL_5366 [Fusarium phyllophilum]|uniref:Clr5 domain-containing protein n=1 Tax=Fusarium phyllophilum TaxID=47803 RepID=A0A8H5JXV4_9HYPO|nr:hypothetical protein FPHYL_5366 [Fusarium phyllophilum]